MLSAEEIDVNGKYPYYIGRGIAENIGSAVLSLRENIRCAVITDSNIAPLYLDKLTSSLASSGIDFRTFVFPAGEQSKNAETYFSVISFLAENGFTRSNAVIALGGGTTGDIAGFAAATYMRGIDIIHVPTTLLAMIDSSVGGKTGIDLPTGKNLVGAFHEPRAVVCDTDFLSSLPEREMRSGCAELVKYGFLKKGFLEKVMRFDEKNAQDIIAGCVSIKSSFVAGDLRDLGDRRLLNFGHTAGHAIEVLSGYTVSHGEAVAIGMSVAARSAFNLGYSREDCFYPLYEALKKFSLPTECEFSANAVFEAAAHDKKRSGDITSVVVPVEVGECAVIDLDEEKFFDFISEGI